MISETGMIRVLFTVTCASAGSGDCPDDDKLEGFRILSAEDEDPKRNAEIAIDREKLVAKLQSRHLFNQTPSLIDIGHYRMPSAKNDSRDVFVGLAQVPGQLFFRNEETMLLRLTPEAPLYLGEMFSNIFGDLKKGPEGKEFCWLSWTIVPLVEALEGRFNPLGMSGVGNC